MTTDGGAQAKRDEIERRWLGVHMVEETRTGQIFYGAAHRHAGADIGWLLQQYDALTAQVAALKAELTQGTIGTLTAELAEAVHANERLTTERDRLRAAVGGWVDSRQKMRDAPNADIRTLCRVHVETAATELEAAYAATTPPAGAQEGNNGR